MELSIQAAALCVVAALLALVVRRGRPEAALLLRLGEVAFLPVARQQGGETPIYLEEADYTPAECGEALAWLQLKGLVSLDYGLPLKNFDYAAYGENLLRGSAALTAAGQEAVEVLELQGAET